MIDPRSTLQLAAIIAAVALRELADIATTAANQLDRVAAVTTAEPTPPAAERAPDHIPDALLVTR